LLLHALEGVVVTFYAVLAELDTTTGDSQATEIEAPWADGTTGSWETVAAGANVRALIIMKGVTTSIGLWRRGSVARCDRWLRFARGRD
jgi:hypothetical protein